MIFYIIQQLISLSRNFYLVNQKNICCSRNYTLRAQVSMLESADKSLLPLFLVLRYSEPPPEGGSLHGIMTLAAWTGMHILLIRLWNTVKRKEINPRSINSAIQNHWRENQLRSSTYIHHHIYINGFIRQENLSELINNAWFIYLPWPSLRLHTMSLDAYAWRTNVQPQQKFQEKVIVVHKKMFLY